MAGRILDLRSIGDPTGPLTPATGVAAVFLMSTGLVCASIGIRRRWLHIFLSMAYMVGLAMTVLILYLVDLPITAEMQLIYLLATAGPAVGAGVVSLFMQNILEGIGAAAGGFSFAMFVLAMHDGGIIQSTGPKIIFISFWTAGVYALQFISRIRPYVLMASTSLMGATSFLLGIDCFAKAGLKEFWMYIWSVNSDYSDTRGTFIISKGMVVELAFVVVVTLLGILSQIRIWLVTKNQKSTSDEARSHTERCREDMEAELGRILEERAAHGKLESVTTLPLCKSPSALPICKSPSTRAPSQDEECNPFDSNATNTFTTTTNPSSSARTSFTISDSPDLIEHPVPKVEGCSYKMPNDVFSQTREVFDGDEISTTSDDQDQSKQINSSGEFLSAVDEKLSRISVETTDPRSSNVYSNATPDEELEADTAQQRPLEDLSPEAKQSQARIPASTTETPEVLQTEKTYLGAEWPFQMDDTPMKQDSRVAEHASDSLLDQKNSIQQLKLTHPESTELVNDQKASDQSLTEFSAALEANILVKDPVAAVPLVNIVPEESQGNESSTDHSLRRFSSQPCADRSKTETIQQRRFSLPASRQLRLKSELEQDSPSQSIINSRTHIWTEHLGSAEQPSQPKEEPDNEIKAAPRGLRQRVTGVRNSMILMPSAPETSEALAQKPHSMPVNRLNPLTAAQQQTRRFPVVPQDPAKQGLRPISGSTNNPLLSPSNVSLPRHSDRGCPTQRQKHPACRASMYSILASPIDEDTVASFPSSPIHGPRSPDRRALLPTQPVTHPTSTEEGDWLVDASREQHDVDLFQSSILSPTPTRSNSDEIVQNLIERQQLEPLRSNPVRAEDTVAQSTLQTVQQPFQDQSQHTIPEHTIHRVSMLAESRKVNAPRQNVLVSSETVTTNACRRPSSLALAVVPKYLPPQQRRVNARLSCALPSPIKGYNESSNSIITVKNSNSSNRITGVRPQPTAQRYISSAPRLARPISAQQFNLAHLRIMHPRAEPVRLK